MESLFYGYQNISFTIEETLYLEVMFTVEKVIAVEVS